MPPAPDPTVQSSYMKNLFAALARRGALDVLEAGAPDTVAAVAAAGRMRWLPIEHNLRTVSVLCRARSQRPALELLADCVHEQFDTPLWKPFVSGAVRLLGRDPAHLGRWIPKAFSVVFRDCGHFAVEPTGNAELRVTLSEIPDLLLGERLWLSSLGVGMRPIFAVCGLDGVAEQVDLDRNARTARYRLAWKVDPAPRG